MRAAVEHEALVVGMTLVPGFLSRNKNFALFEDPEVRRARVRAALLRGIVRQLSGAHGKVEALHVVTGMDVRELRYRVAGVRMDRRAVLTDLEYACVAYLAGRASVEGLKANEEDRARIEGALRRLASGVVLADIEAGRNN
jgi:hypothetical protein